MNSRNRFHDHFLQWRPMRVVNLAEGCRIGRTVFTYSLDEQIGLEHEGYSVDALVSSQKPLSVEERRPLPAVPGVGPAHSALSILRPSIHGPPLRRLHTNQRTYCTNTHRSSDNAILLDKASLRPLHLDTN